MSMLLIALIVNETTAVRNEELWW